MSALDVLVLAQEEGIPPTHIAANIALPLGILVFCGSIYVLVWAVYGAKKGALVYGTAFSAFAAMMGVFWWFGAPGTPIATGLTYFPGQSNDRYQGKWYPMEPGSQRAGFFEVTNSLENLQTPVEFTGQQDVPPEQREANPASRALTGDLSAAIDSMIALYLPTGEDGSPIIGAGRRQRMMAKAGMPGPGEKPGDPFFTARVKPNPDDPSLPTIFVTEDRRLRVAGAPLQVVAHFVTADPEAPPRDRQVVVEEANWYAFKDPGALWFPSAVWTAVFGLLFVLCLAGLERVEQREKRTLAEREPVPA